MVSNPAFAYHPSDSPRGFGALVQASFALWFASLRPVLWPALAYSIASQLPWLPWWWATRARFEQEPLRAWITPGLFRPDAATLAFGAAATLASLLFALVMLERQGRMARGLAPGAGLGNAARALPAALLATLGYLALNLLALAPVVVAWFWGVAQDDALALLLALLVGLLLAAVPLAWVSVAAGFFYPAIVLDGRGAMDALRESFRRVRGRWVLAAGLVSLLLLTFLGVFSTVGAFPLVGAGMIAFWLDGPDALLRPGWLVWGQLASAPLLALTLPLATAGYLVAWEELGLRRRAQ